ncbi:hypothetical protein SAMN04488012_110117 [Palleronia salina]|uniref:Uncharacterized protein n=1 Tax=Palleronia salina TaxID=313368 RepID=A0A1M6JV37_9RHOB|nr:hypothetical protein [Palleronia salina]SHJ50543.1 hypothetical protein SAMN04488012_110117 [Palleronia salina]
MRWIVLLACLATAGCATGPAPSASGGAGVRPVAVTLFRDTVTARMSDGGLCTGVREGRAGPWSTTLAGCPQTWPVAVLRPTGRPRLPLAPAAEAPWVTITPPDRPALGFGPRVGS